MTASSLPRDPSAVPVVWSWQDRLAARIDSVIDGPLDWPLRLFTGGANLQFHKTFPSRLDMWIRDSAFNLVIGRFWLEVFERDTPEQRANYKAYRKAERDAAKWAIEDSKDSA